ncbi:MAG: hypothetical protein H6855_05195 [Rhodospirillales bacterium]|nr:hypothetical protein [Rhodospirillales bacterium]
MSSILPAGIAAQQALTQQAVALETVKKSAEADRALANILAETVDNVPTGSRGTVVNIQA